MIKTVVITALIIWVFAPDHLNAQTQNDDSLTITANFAEEEITPGERLELNLSRGLTPAEGRLAVFIGQTDVSSLFSLEGPTLSYEPDLFPLAEGENQVSVYLVALDGEWKMLEEIPFKVGAKIHRETPPKIWQRAIPKQKIPPKTNPIRLKNQPKSNLRRTFRSILKARIKF